MPNREKMRRIMFERDMTQADLARSMGVSPSGVTKIMRKGTDIRESTLKRICQALGCRAEDIW